MNKVNLEQSGRKEKILFIITQSEIGGAQRYVALAGNWLKKNGYDVLVATGGKQAIGNLETINLKHLKRSPNPLSALLVIREIYQLIKKEKPDTLFLCSTMAGVLGSIAGSLAKMFHVSGSKLHVLYRIGGWAFNDPRPFWQKKLIIFFERFASRYKDKIIVNSQYDFQTALDNKITKEEKLVKIYNGINSDEINFLSREAAREKLDLANGRIVVGAIANFYKTKGLACLIEATHLLCSMFQAPSFKLVIIGDGKERPILERLIEKHNLKDKVILAGRIKNAAIYLKAFDLLVLPSLKEGFPWVILEAMAANIPIVATKVGAIPEVLENEKSALLVAPNNPAELAKKIQDLLENPGKAKILAENAQAQLSHFTCEAMMQQTEKAIKSL